MTGPSRSAGPQQAWMEVPDDALLARAARGEAAATDAFVERFGDRLCSFLVRIVHDCQWADDLAQEVLVRALRDAHRFDPAWPVGVWLFRIGRNLALDLLRREGAHRARLDRLGALSQANSPAAVTTAEQREFQVALEAELLRLPEEFRTVFLLREREGLRYEEIGAVLSISPKTVSSRLHRARQQLRSRLREFFEP